MVLPCQYHRVNGVAQGFTTIAVVILVGYLLAHVRVLDLSAHRVLADVAFFVGAPALLFTVLAGADVGRLFSHTLAATVVGVIVPVLIYTSVARRVWHRPLAETVIGNFSAAYVNAGNLGIPIAGYVLGDAALVGPILLLQMVILQPIGLLLLDHDRLGGPFRWRSVITRPLTNPMTVGALLGVAVAASAVTVPGPVLEPLRLLGGLAIPCMLLGYGISLRLGPRFGGGVPAEVTLTSVLKALVQPAVAYAAGRFVLDLTPAELLAVTVTSALPTAQNVFTHATRFGRGEAVARDTILVTTIACLPMIVLIVAVLG